MWVNDFKGRVFVSHGAFNWCGVLTSSLAKTSFALKDVMKAYYFCYCHMSYRLKIWVGYFRHFKITPVLFNSLIQLKKIISY